MRASFIGGLLSVAASACAYAGETALDVKVGSLGAGIELAHAFGDHVGIRVGWNGLTYKRTDSRDNIDYDAKLKLNTIEALADWFPFANNFRITAGVMNNKNKFDLTGKPSGGGTYTINDVTYNASDVGSLDGRLSFRSAAPYVGLGYGRPVGSGLTLVADLGVLFQGKPTVSLQAVCSPTAPPGTCASLQNDVAAEQSRLADDVKDFRYYPVAAIGIAYRF